MTRSLILFAVIAFNMTSCVNDLDAIKKITFDENTPDETTRNLHVIFDEDGYAKVEIYAALAETKRGKNHITTVKDSLRVNFFNNTGKIVSTLSALYGEVNFTLGTLIVRDSVRLYNFEKKQILETEALYWNQKDSSIYSLSQVIVRSPKGVILGDGIRTKQDFSYYEFLKPQGKMELEKELEID